MDDDRDGPRLPGSTTSRNLRDANLADMFSDERSIFHDLEAHSDDLEWYDSIRQRSLELRNEGKAALAQLIEEEFERSVPDDQSSRYYRAKTLRIALQTRVRPISPERWEKAFSYATNLTQLSETERSVLFAAESMRGLIATVEHALRGQVMRSWYWILRELYTASDPDWAVGGAAASPDGRVSSFVTAQCVHAVMDLSESLKATHNLCNAMSKATKYIALIKNRGVPENWRKIDLERLAQSCRNTLTRFSPNLAFRLTGISDITSSNVEEFITTTLREQVKTALKHAEDELISVIEEARLFRKTEVRKAKSEVHQNSIVTEPKNEPEPKRLKKALAESKGGHSIALSGLEKAKFRTSKALEAIDSKDDPWGKAAGSFLVASSAVQEGLGAAQRFLSSLIDQQLAASQLSDGQQWEPADLVFAGAARWRLMQNENLNKDERVTLSASLLGQKMDANGTFILRRPYHSANSTSYFAASFGVMAALTDLFRAAKTPLNRSLAAKLLPELERRRVRNALKTLICI
jgi:hypothetical protein